MSYSDENELLSGMKVLKKSVKMPGQKKKSPDPGVVGQTSSPLRQEPQIWRRM